MDMAMAIIKKFLISLKICFCVISLIFMLSFILNSYCVLK